MNDGLTVLVIVIVGVIIGFISGYASTAKGIQDDCRMLKTFRIQDTAYTCEARNG